MRDPYKDVRSLLPWMMRGTAGVITIPCLAYGLFLIVDAPSFIGVGSKVHGMVILCLGVLTGRYAVDGKTGLTVLDEVMQSRDEDS